MEILDVSESTEAIMKIREFVDWEVPSKQQKWMISLIGNFKDSRRKIISAWTEKFNEIIHHEAICTALTHAELSRSWTKGMKGGNQAYLCDDDMKALELEIRDRAMMCKALNTTTIMDEVVRLKITD